MKLNLQIELRFSQQTAFYAALLFLMLGGTSRLASESLTLSTYYPSPLGVYKQLVTTGTGNFNTILARDGGYVGIGTDSPAYKLEIIGGDMHASGNASIDGSAKVGGSLNVGSGATIDNVGDASFSNAVAIGPGTGFLPEGGLRVASDAQIDGYIINLCQTISYDANGYTYCPDNRMTMIGLDNGGSNLQDSTPIINPLGPGQPRSSNGEPFCTTGYELGSEAYPPGHKCTGIPPAGLMYCCRFQ